MAPEPLEPDDPEEEWTAGPGQEGGHQTGNGLGRSSGKELVVVLGRVHDGHLRVKPDQKV